MLRLLNVKICCVSSLSNKPEVRKAASNFKSNFVLYCLTQTLIKTGKMYMLKIVILYRNVYLFIILASWRGFVTTYSLFKTHAAKVTKIL